MDDMLKMLETRRSCRNYKPDMVPSEIVEKILRAETFSPTEMNR